MNIVVLQGSLSSAPESRDLPSGDRLVTYEVTTRAEGQPADSVPVVWFDAPARSADLGAGTEVVVTGRVRRRFFQAGGARSSRTEVVAASVIPARQRKRVAGAIDAAVAALAEHPEG
ncbi:single-stranded DNA-binding protein [Aquihabitans sp. G128]|uniref:single-stranded DNA-binding protein n=1 Tax=Aquihabitans sp. G128 TaxID=2849779 RepID=UPI001C220916|nr:single-stranded DNA-binding protein [Aquihabitans sp. G128]QXC61934.1 single-stranded DNA-binding protein [Aquihabitans sp. G128]